MKVLIACEFSGVVRDAFAALGMKRGVATCCLASGRGSTFKAMFWITVTAGGI